MKGHDGFNHYTPRPGDTREVIIEGAKFLWSAVWESKTARIAAGVMSILVVCEITWANQYVKDKLSTILIGKAESDQK